MLTLTTVTKLYGSVRVIDALDLSVEAGDALGIVGPNGAGKTTMLNLIAGTVTPTTGRVAFQGQDITHTPAEVRCRRGIGRTYQIPQPFLGMTVFENVLVGATHGRGRREDHAAYTTSVEALELSGMLHQANAMAGSLSLLERKRLELARALATQPRLLLLDEIAGGLVETEVHELVGTIRALHQSGVTIVWIEHIVHALLSVVTRLLAIDFGRKLVEGEPQTVMASREVREVYLGVEVA